MKILAPSVIIPLGLVVSTVSVAYAGSAAIELAQNVPAGVGSDPSLELSSAALASLPASAGASVVFSALSASGGGGGRGRSGDFGDLSGSPLAFSATWGIDNGINVSNGNTGANGTNQGLPQGCSADDVGNDVDAVALSFRYRIDGDAIDPTTYRVEGVTPDCATLSPDNEDNEAYTITLVGQFGDTVTEAGSGEPVVDALEVEYTDVALVMPDGSTITTTGTVSTPPFPEGVRTHSAWLRPLIGTGDNQCPTSYTDVQGQSGQPVSTVAIRLVFTGGVTRLDRTGFDDGRGGAGTGFPGSPGSTAGTDDLQNFSVDFVVNGQVSDPIEPVAFGDQFNVPNILDTDNYVDLCMPAGWLPSGATDIVVAVEPNSVFLPSDQPNAEPLEFSVSPCTDYPETALQTGCEGTSAVP